jgi:hypothetical protein
MLEFAVKNDKVILCLPSHTTHYLKPLDRSFIKPLKTYFYQVCQNWTLINEKQKITRLQFCKLLCHASSRAATTATGAAGCRATGILPLERSAIPDHAFVLSESSSCIDHPHEPEQRSTSPQPSKSTSSNDYAQSPTESNDHVNAPPTPNNVLQQVSPIPQIPKVTHSRRKQTATVLTDDDFISEKKIKASSRNHKVKNHRQLQETCQTQNLLQTAGSFVVVVR